MVRIWLNHWFSTAYNIIQLIKRDDPDFAIIGSNANPQSPIMTVCDEWYLEPSLPDDEYIEYCLKFCRDHAVDVFMPRRGALIISKEKKCFDEIGIKVMVEEYEIMNALNHKERAYRLFKEKGIGQIPDYDVVTTVDQFKASYCRLAEKYGRVCFKFVKDEGGKSYRLIDNDRHGYSALFKKITTRMTYDDAVSALSERVTFSPMIVMPYLPGDEVSVDCLQTEQGLIAIPRIKDTTRIEKIRYDETILEYCNEIYKALPLNNPCNIQFKYLGETPYFLEVNTRMSGGIQMACSASGVNIPNIAVNKLLGINKSWLNKREQKNVCHIEIPLVLNPS